MVNAIESPTEIRQERSMKMIPHIKPDISPAFEWNRMDAEIGVKLVKHDNTSSAIKCFRNNRQYLSNYAYWFYLSTLWVQKSSATDLSEWKRLFSSDRPDRQRCIMKPSELEVFHALPDMVTAYRAHRPGETDWIAYTINLDTAIRFAFRRGVKSIAEYEIAKDELLAYFSRRDEYEVLLLDKSKARLKRVLKIVINDSHI
jgi:hypothetical protein